jgi:hypothetical protein
MHSLLGIFGVGTAYATGTMPTIGTSDIAATAGPLFASLWDIVSYILVTFGPPLMYIVAIVSIVVAIYRKVHFGHVF